MGASRLDDADTERLVARAQKGDAGAFRRLYLRYYDLVYGYGRTMLRDAHEAEDVTQDVFIRVMRMLPRYEVHADCPFRILLLRITRNRSLDYIREKQRCEPLQLGEGDDRFELGQLEEDPPGAFDGLPDARLTACLNRLPLSQRQVLVLRYVLDFSPREVAEVVGATPQAVRNLQYRGLRDLRASLAPSALPA